mmetsp:Transcript_19377/g.31902  ORF Transcript_19377/g.31902 Transcript_19377/m.31902 type:complete len:131 (-) Transcript_19377:103-495(-)
MVCKLDLLRPHSRNPLPKGLAQRIQAHSQEYPFLAHFRIRLCAEYCVENCEERSAHSATCWLGYVMLNRLLEPQSKSAAASAPYLKCLTESFVWSMNSGVDEVREKHNSPSRLKETLKVRSIQLPSPDSW